MKKTIISLFIAGLSLAGANAAVITPQQALSRVQSGRSNVAAMGGKEARLVHTQLTKAGSPAIYVFERADSQTGYLLLSADDIAYPVLGYADEGEFDAEAMAPAMKWWLEQYADQIEYASANGNAGEGVQTALLTRSRAAREAIAPMIASHWDQVAPFNDQCPLLGVDRTYTGCVATAMAQVMNYWKYPQRGTGSISYTAEDIQKKLTMNFDAKDFDWDNIINDYLPGQYTPEQAEAVAYLMKACGYSVKMNYSNDASGALAMYIRRGLTHYFKYDENAVYTLRDYHSASEWEELIYDNLKNVGPLLYGGSSTVGGGHSFVCDGYSTDGLFHFNWGWTGMSDGYFALSALNPDALGTGGGSGGGYNFDQDALLGIQPPTGQPVIPQPDRVTQMGSLTASVNNAGVLSLGLDVQAEPMWVNYNATNVNVVFGAKIRSNAADGATVCTPINPQAVRLQPGYGISAAAVKGKVDLPTLDLADGTYTVSIVTIPASEIDEASNDNWLDPHTYYGYTTEATLTKAGDSYTVNCEAAPQLRIVDAEFTTGLYYGCLQKIKITVANDSDMELTSGFAPLLALGSNLTFLGQSISLSVPAHSTVTREWVTELFDLSNGTVITSNTSLLLTFLDEITYQVLTDQCLKQVVMSPTPTVPRITLDDTPTVKNAVMGTYEEPGFVANVAYITNPYDIGITMNLTQTRGYCAYNIAAAICEFVTEDHDQISLLTYGAAPLFIDALGGNAFKPEEHHATIDVTASYPLLEPGKMYPVLAAYIAANGGLSIISGGEALYLCVSDPSGIEDVVSGEATVSISYDPATATATAAAEAAVVEMSATDVSGRLTARSNGNALDLSQAPAGIAILKATDAAGNTTTLKVRL